MRKRLRLTGRTGVTLAAVLGITLIVGVALAVVLVQVSVDVTSDEFTPSTTTSSTTTTTVATNGLAVALGTGANNGACGSYGTGPLAFSDFAFLMNDGQVDPNDVQYLCIRNFGSSNITSVLFSPSVLTSGEAACSSAEEAVDPDGTGCGTDGELADLLDFSLTLTFANSTATSSCVTHNSAIVSPNTTPGQLELIGQASGQAFQSGGECVFRIDLRFASTFDDDTKLAASTDTVSYLMDVTAAP